MERATHYLQHARRPSAPTMYLGSNITRSLITQVGMKTRKIGGQLARHPHPDFIQYIYIKKVCCRGSFILQPMRASPTRGSLLPLV